MAYLNTAGATPAQPGAITSVVAAGANPTKAEYDALRADVLATRTALVALINAFAARRTT